MPRIEDRVFSAFFFITVTTIVISAGLFSFMPKREKQLLKDQLLHLGWNALQLSGLLLVFIIKISFVILSNIIEVMSFIWFILSKVLGALYVVLIDIRDLAFDIEYAEFWHYCKSSTVQLWQFLSLFFTTMWQFISGAGTTIAMFASEQTAGATEEYLQNTFEQGGEHIGNIWTDLKVILKLLQKSGKILTCKLLNYGLNSGNYYFVESCNSVFFHFGVAVFMSLLVLFIVRKFSNSPTSTTTPEASEREIHEPQARRPFYRDQGEDDIYSDDEEDNPYHQQRNIPQTTDQEHQRTMHEGEGAQGDGERVTIDREIYDDIFSSDEDNGSEAGDVISEDDAGDTDVLIDGDAAEQAADT